MMKSIIVALLVFCMAMSCIQVIAPPEPPLYPLPELNFEIECSDTSIEIGDIFEVEFWIKNSESKNVDAWVVDISFQSGISATLVNMSTFWCTDFYYNGTIGEDNITEIQASNKNSTSNDTLLFNVSFEAESDGDCYIGFESVEVYWNGSSIENSTSGITVTVCSEGHGDDDDDDDGGGDIPDDNTTDNTTDNDQNDTNDNTTDNNNVTENMPPVADFGGPYIVEVGESIYFDASGSTDDNNSIVSYRWNFGDGVGGTGIKITHSYNDAGNYTVTLTVTDEEGLTGTQTTIVTVEFIPEEINGSSNEEDVSWIFWVIAIIGIIVLVVMYIMSKYEIER